VRNNVAFMYSTLVTGFCGLNRNTNLQNSEFWQMHYILLFPVGWIGIQNRCTKIYCTVFNVPALFYLFPYGTLWARINVESISSRSYLLISTLSLLKEDPLILDSKLIKIVRLIFTHKREQKYISMTCSVRFLNHKKYWKFHSQKVTIHYSYNTASSYFKIENTNTRLRKVEKVHLSICAAASCSLSWD
jgi:hypothetical protein